MLRFDRQAKTLSQLNSPSLKDSTLTERYDLQECIINSPEAFFAEIGQDLILLGSEIEPSSTVQDRIDLLAIDKEGALVVIELKRGHHKLQMLQAISYAGMIAKWTPEDILELLGEDEKEHLTDFLEVDLEDVNRRQRIVLVAEAYDYALLSGAEWLSESYGVDVTCCRLSVATDSGSDSEYFVCSNVFPAPELAQEAVQRGRRPVTEGRRWSTWDDALTGITNSAVADHFAKQIRAGQESYLLKRTLTYRIRGKKRWGLTARNRNAYIWQAGRFDGDIEYWRGGLSDPTSVAPVKSGTCLRASLSTPEDFAFFDQSVTQGLQGVVWTDGGPGSPASKGADQESSASQPPGT